MSLDDNNFTVSVETDLQSLGESLKADFTDLMENYTQGWLTENYLQNLDYAEILYLEQYIKQLIDTEVQLMALGDFFSSGFIPESSHFFTDTNNNEEFYSTQKLELPEEKELAFESEKKRVLTHNNNYLKSPKSDKENNKKPMMLSEIREKKSELEEVKLDNYEERLSEKNQFIWQEKQDSENLINQTSITGKSQEDKKTEIRENERENLVINHQESGENEKKKNESSYSSELNNEKNIYQEKEITQWLENELEIIEEKAENKSISLPLNESVKGLGELAEFLNNSQGEFSQIIEESLSELEKIEPDNYEERLSEKNQLIWQEKQDSENIINQTDITKKSQEDKKTEIRENEKENLVINNQEKEENQWLENELEIIEEKAENKSISLPLNESVKGLGELAEFEQNNITNPTQKNNNVQDLRNKNLLLPNNDILSNNLGFIKQPAQYSEYLSTLTNNKEINIPYFWSEDYLNPEENQLESSETLINKVTEVLESQQVQKNNQSDLSLNRGLLLNQNLEEMNNSSFNLDITPVKETDLTIILEAISEEINRDYQRFYGEKI